MSTVKIKNRITGEVFFEHEGPLAGADLRRTNLRWADLREANLSGADLSGANLRRADLRRADLSGTVLPNGKTYKNFVAELPRLLTAGGKTVDEVAQHWGCHSWENCPMHAAFGASGISEVPEEWRERAELFVILFDAGALCRPSSEDEV